MRKSLSIIKATALEILSGPLTLLVLLAALTLTVLAPAFHYHQFGDPTRMARDAGLSALFTCGSVIAVFGTIRAIRREVESGTMEMALAYPVSRTCFFLSKFLGALVAYLVCSAVIVGATFVIFEGAAVGGVIARQTGDISKIFGPFLACGVAILLLPLLIGAALDRFARFRFVLTAICLAFVLALIGGGVAAVLSKGDVLRLLPVALLVMQPSLLLMAVAAACAVRMKANAAAAAVGVVFAALVPTVGNYYLVDVLANGGSLPLGYLGLATAVTWPALVAILLLGVEFINGRDIQWTT